MLSMLVAAAAALQITYVANEGYMIAAGEDAVLVDALHSGGIEEYEAPSTEARDAMRSASGPFSRVDLVLVSHRHVDHFDAATLASHLEHDSGARMISTSDIVEAAARQGAPEDRLEKVPYPQNAERIRRELRGVAVEILRLDHAGYPQPRYQLPSLGHLVVIGGKKILHLGDADVTEENFRRYRLVDEGIEVALVPCWYLQSERGRRIVRDLVRPRWVVAMHIPPDERDAVEMQLEDQPQVVVFTHSMETRLF